jgi:hypothetical protein
MHPWLLNPEKWLALPAGPVETMPPDELERALAPLVEQGLAEIEGTPDGGIKVRPTEKCLREVAEEKRRVRAQAESN